ncbi:hypothetical protein MLD38_015856 [Melastoma candidum]|uniref:Uncharacterized protein n=1 Tax=Melastoma candidum TaxID=119954 RepID=A0ACB9RQY3_9MYRT|nr:hypothetical protein MLD38_015856 [Melastoma candidum]
MEATTPFEYQAVVSLLGSDGIISLISSTHLKSPSSIRGKCFFSCNLVLSFLLKDLPYKSTVSTSVISLSSTSKSIWLHESEEPIEGIKKTKITCRTANEKG